MNEIDNNNNAIFDKSKPVYDCKDPLFKIPRIVYTPDNYKKKKDTNSKNEIKNYDNKINEKIEDLKKLKAEKYIRLKKIQTGETLTLEQAYEIVNKYSSDKLIDSSQEYWKLYQNYDAAQYLFNDNNNNDNILKFYGLVYTIDEAKKTANDNNQSFFVWYHNSYELDNFASKLYFIDIYNIENDLLDKQNWAIHDNVTTGLLKFEAYDNEDAHSNSDNINKIKTLLETSNKNNELMNEQYMVLAKNNLTDYNVNISVIDNLNNKITTYGQAINMNNYETNINNNILMALGIALIIVIIIFVAVMVYFNNISGGKIKLFGLNNNIGSIQ